VLRAQLVDATPAGIKLLSKVVFMTQEKQFRLSAVQKSDVWQWGFTLSLQLLIITT